MPEIIMAFAPLTFLIIYALKTRRMAESMVLATLLAMVLLHRQHFLTGTIDALYAQLSNSSYQFVLCIIIGFGGMITLFQESGALMGFRDLLLRVAKGPKRTLVLAWCMSVVMFVDEYLNALTVTFSMREITDRNRIPREHLALQANIMACCLCMTIPFSSWTAFSVGLVSEYDLGFQDYLRAIPYMIYPLCMMLLCLLLAVGAFPKIGPLKRAYQRVQAGGPAFERDEKAEKLVDIADVDESRVSPAWNAMVPLAFLLVGATVFAVGGCWVVMTIAIPVFVPLALSMGVAAPVIIAAVMSGIALGYSTCFYADAVFMTTAGTGVSNITIIRTTIPYAAGAAVIAVVGFLLCGAGVF